MVFPKKKVYSLQCEWGSCEDVIEDLDDFYHHLDDHFWRDIAALPIAPGTTLVCQWRECNFVTSDGHQLLRHIFFHGFHTKIKWLGYLMHQSSNSHDCQVHQNRNIIPDLPETGFKCCWDDCCIVVDIPDQFYNHVSEHALISEPTKTPEGKLLFKCLWEGCTYTYTLSSTSPSLGRYKLRGHTMTHTQERCYACPWCGNLYVNKTKLIDHYTRQMNAESHCFQCTHCSRTFASERILKDHMRHHVNHYQCPKCAMTCPNPSSLKHHIRYKHSTERPYACEFCEYRSKSSHDLQTHVQFHQRDLAYHCQVADCDYVVRSIQNLRYHYRIRHGSDDGKYYVCHLCSKKYGTGYQLTHHLRKAHDFQWPPGHCRFRYKENEDGMFRLQTFRYESTSTKQLAFIESAVPDESEAAGTSNSKQNMAVKKPKRKRRCENSKRVTRAKVGVKTKKVDLASSPGAVAPCSSRKIMTKRSSKEKPAVSKAARKRYVRKRKPWSPKKSTKKSAKSETPKKMKKRKASDQHSESMPDLYINSECLEAADALCNMKTNSVKKKKQAASPKDCGEDLAPKATTSNESLLAEVFQNSGAGVVDGEDNSYMVTTRNSSNKKSRTRQKLNFTKAKKKLRLAEDASTTKSTISSAPSSSEIPSTPHAQGVRDCTVDLVPLEEPIFPNHHRIYCNTVPEAPTTSEPADHDGHASPNLTEMSSLANTVEKKLGDRPGFCENAPVQLDPSERSAVRDIAQPSQNSVDQGNANSVSPALPRVSDRKNVCWVESEQGVSRTRMTSRTRVVTLDTGYEADASKVSLTPSITEVVQSENEVETLHSVSALPECADEVDFGYETSSAIPSQGSSVQSKTTGPSGQKKVVEVDSGQIVQDDDGNKTIINVGGDEFYLVSGTHGTSGGMVYCLVKCSEFVEGKSK